MKNLQHFKIEDNKNKEALAQSKLEEVEFDLKNEKNNNSNLQLKVGSIE